MAMGTGTKSLHPGMGRRRGTGKTTGTRVPERSLASGGGA